jgi:hypothetical protein
VPPAEADAEREVTEITLARTNVARTTSGGLRESILGFLRDGMSLFTCLLLQCLLQQRARLAVAGGHVRGQV